MARTNFRMNDEPIITLLGGTTDAGALVEL